MLGMGYGRFWPEDGLWNPCNSLPTPADLLAHPLLQQAMSGLTPANVWDSHVHLVGIGDLRSNVPVNVWVNPAMSSWGHPLLKTQMAFYLNACCVSQFPSIDESYVSRLYGLARDFPPGMKFMLLAFDYFYDQQGKRQLEKSAMYTSNDYAQQVASRFSERFEWIASVHPYREDAIDELKRVAKLGARAIKWLPAAMGIDPASSRCDEFYETLITLNLPLLTHAGKEQAVENHAGEHLGHPLKLRRALDKGVRVIVAHCASLGVYPDTDSGKKNVTETSYKLFARLMAEKHYENTLTGDLSALVQINRDPFVIRDLLSRTDWHARLINGSDYPLPGVLPLVSLRKIVGWGLIEQSSADYLVKLRRYNPLLFDFVLKRSLRYNGKRIADVAFESCSQFFSSSI